MATVKEQHEGEEAEPNTLKDKWGNERPWDPERYPETSAAREGHITKPSGQGGATPKSRPDHQDMFPKNHEDPEAKEYGQLLARKEQGEDIDVNQEWASRKGLNKNTESRGESAADRQARTERVGSKDSPKS